MKIINVKEAHKIDKHTCKTEKIKTIDLINRTGKVLFDEFTFKFNPEKTDEIQIFSGPGNNGCDALVMAGLLNEAGFNTKVIIVDKVNTDGKEIINKYNLDIIYLKQIDNLEQLVKTSKYIIDGIFGTGLNKNLNKTHLQLVGLINASGATIFSIDIPTGINGDNGLVMKGAIKADFVSIINNYKLGNLLNDAPDYHKDYKIVNINLLDEIVEKDKILLRKDNIPLLIRRKKNSHKYHYGNVLIIGGALEMMGAASLSSYAALRMGAGLVNLAVNDRLKGMVKLNYPEVIINYYHDFITFKQCLNNKNAALFGPGFGKNNPEGYKILEALLKLDIPIVIDADGLFYLKDFLDENLKNVIITPHSGEFASMLGIDTELLLKYAYEYVNEFSKRSKATVVLKGHCSLIAKDGITYFSNYGNPGMATAGSGDVLAGIIASLLGFGLDSFAASKLGVYIHSLAGNLAANEKGEYSMIASDIINNLPHAIKACIKVDN